MRLRAELDVYANLRPARQDDVDLLHRPRARRRHLLRRPGCPRRRHRLRHVRVPPEPGRADRAGGPSSSRAPAAGRLTSVDKANVLETSRMWRRVATEVAAEYAGRRVRAHARRQRGHAARPGARALRRARDREHVRRHPLGRGRRGHRAGSGWPARRASATAARASSSPCTARLPTSPGRASRTRRRCCARPRSCSRTVSGARTRPAASSGRRPGARRGADAGSGRDGDDDAVRRRRLTFARRLGLDLEAERPALASGRQRRCAAPGQAELDRRAGPPRATGEARHAGRHDRAGRARVPG